MTFDLEKLDLREKYSFNVVVADGEERFAGKLDLKPNKITIVIMGEQNHDRKCSIGWSDIDRLICRDGNKSFFLYNLIFCNATRRVISRHPKHIGYFETTFDVGFLIFCPSNVHSENCFHSISIGANALEQWIGNTETQEKIIRSYHKKESIFENPQNLDEFLVEIGDIGTLRVSYNLSIHSSSPDFKSGILFPPSLIMSFNSSLDCEEIKKVYDRTYNLLAFLIGSDFGVNKVDVGFSNYGFDNAGSLYYPSKLFWPKSKNNITFFPLGKDIRFDSLGLPSLPLKIFSKYFALNDIEIEYWKKYLRYKRMENTEERFLGYFRLLEKLCYKKKSYLQEDLLTKLCKKHEPYLIKKFDDKKSVKSFLKGIHRYNSSKYNTEKCVQDFYTLIPSDTSNNWKFQKKDIGNICKLRNDITHANDYHQRGREILEKEHFIETLLILAFCKKLDVNLEMSCKLIDRISGYHLITKREI